MPALPKSFSLNDESLRTIPSGPPALEILAALYKTPTSKEDRQANQLLTALATTSKEGHQANPFFAQVGYRGLQV